MISCCTDSLTEPFIGDVILNLSGIMIGFALFFAFFGCIADLVICNAREGCCPEQAGKIQEG